MANTTIDISNLDFDSIKTALKTYLKNTSSFTDYNFEGSNLSTLLNLLTYNTHYNAFYLNMVANEMFMDSAVKRSSVVSHAKLLNYTPRSKSASKAYIHLSMSGVSSQSVTIPSGTIFLSETINGKNYSFVTRQDYTENVANNACTFYNVKLYQGQILSYTYPVTSDNITQTFKIPDKNIDTSTLKVYVKEAPNSLVVDSYNKASAILELTSTSMVYFLQESIDEYYEIYFGDGILGKKLDIGNVVYIEYLSTKGLEADGASKFTLMQSLGNFTTLIFLSESAVGGAEKESIDSIKYNAPKKFSSNGRAVTKSDYINILENSSDIINIESVNVWGGEDNVPPEYGKIFIAIKPKGSYSISPSQKDRLIKEVIRPISVVSVNPEIVDVDYTYIKLNITLLLDRSKSLLPTSTILSTAKDSVINYANKTLNKFNSVFSLPDFIYQVKISNPSIISVDEKLFLSKQIIPTLGSPNRISLSFETPLKKNFETGVLNTSAFTYISPETGNTYTGVQLEAVPLVFNSVETIDVSQPGSNYSTTPTVSIFGDGTGATAIAEIVNGRIKSITVTDQGKNYTQAVGIISGGGGKGATCKINLSGNIIKLRAFYYNNNIKYILQDNVGYIDTRTGVLELENFMPNDVENPLGIFEITVEPDTSIIKSTRDKIITIDTLSNSSISINAETYG